MRINKLFVTGLIVSASFIGTQSSALAQGAPLGGPEGEAVAASAAAPNPQVVAFDDQQFPNADADKDGTVTAVEFTTWISGLKTAEMQKAGEPADGAAVKADADGAHAKGDADKDGILTKAELVTFFGG